MISIESKKFLYDQLKEICRVSLNKEKVMPEEEFNSLTDRELIEYVFKYRDRQKVYANGKFARAYIELPDCDLEGCNLKGIELSRFIPGVIEDGQIRKSKINLRNTGAIINISTVFHNEERITDDGYECITDLTDCNFRGCRIYGRTQEEIKRYSDNDRVKYKFRGIESLDRQYLKRRELHNLTEEERKLSDQVYSRLIDKLSLSFSLQKNQEVDLTDYDFSGLTEKEKEIIIQNINGYRINISFTGIDINILGRETKYSQIMSLKDAMKVGNKAYIQEFIDTYPDKSFVARFVESEYKKGRKTYSDLKRYVATEEILKKYADYEYERNPKNFKSQDYKYLSERTFSTIILDALKKGRYHEILEQAKSIPDALAEKIVRISLEHSCDKFLATFLRLCPVRFSQGTLINIYDKKGLDIIPKENREEALYAHVLFSEYEKGNMEFVEDNLEFANSSVFSRIIEAECNKGRYEFAKQHFKYAPENVKKIILRDAYKKRDINFLTEQIHSIRNKDERNNVLVEIFKSNPQDFANIVDLFPQNMINAIAINFSNEENLEALEAFWKFIPISVQRQIAKEFEMKGNFEFSNKIAFNGIPKDLLERGLVSTRELEKFIRNSWEEGNSGRILFKTISTYPNKIDLIKKLIRMGEDVNYSSKAYGSNKPLSIIQVAMGIAEKDVRDNVIYELLKANVDTKTNIKVKLKPKHSKNVYEGPAEDALEFKKLTSNMILIRRFFSEEMHLNDKEISSLKKFLKKNGKMPTDKELFEFSFRKTIFDYFLITKKIFTENPEVLLKPLDLLYAQIMFFRDIGIDVKNPNFMDTVGLENNEFVKRYGRIIAKGYNGEPEKIEEVVNQMLIGMYPIPSNIMLLKKCIEGDKKMILVNEDRKNGDLLRVYENGSVLEFTDGKVLPIEQRELLIEMLKSGYKSKTTDIDSEVERKEREKAANEILKKLQDPRLSQNARIYTAYSDGGAQTAKDLNDKMQIDNKAAKVKYLVIDINGVTILEPFGQKNNATFLSLTDEEVKSRISKFGRKGAIDNGFYKIIHEGNAVDAYNYSSNHLVRILDMAIEDRERMIKILGNVKNEGKKFCNLLTLESKFGALRLAEEYGLSKEEILGVGATLQENDRKGEEIDEK